jgi:TatD DNase family protein
VNIIDTHTHLYLPEFDADKEEMLAAAQKAGVNQFYLPAIDSETHDKMIAMEEAFPVCKAMMGVHPCSIKENYLDELAIAEAWWEKRDFIAVGEIGLDFYWDKTFTAEQHIAFRRQIEWAIQKKVPIVIHSRNSTDECIKVLKDYTSSGLTGVFHCFSGSYEQAKEIMKLDFYIGIGGVLTFKNAGLGEVLKNISLEKVILETDAPYLAPVPFRGKRNEPAYLEYVVAKIAELQGIERELVAQSTTQNALKLFKQI